MSRIDEIKEQIEKLEDRLFYLNLKDRFTTEDRNRQAKIYLELAQLRRQLA